MFKNKDDIKIIYADLNTIQSISNLEKNWKKEGIDNDMNPYSIEEIRRAILERTIIIAKYKLNIIGFLFFEIDEKKKICEVDAIYVDHHYRKQGIGHLLMEFFLGIEAVKLCNKIYLLADSIYEKKLIDFYNQYGFKKVAVKMLRKKL